ncbi:cysteine--tRNA ligase [Panacagrimonas sp.]|uniref:cysteine--tRNA ligase n=1 Tax=Panacagrimonas sp. TaxID=2480088 RepID=UPI003B527DF7
MQLHNTLSGRKEVFVPIDPQRVTMYVCGPTVYSYAHIGNARPAVVFDVLARVLRRHYPAVVYVRNITDIDDKINAAAAKEGVDIRVITDRYAAIYHEDMAALGVAPPDHAPRVTEHLPQITSMIERLIGSGHAYAEQGHVLFHTPSFADYGLLSGRDEQALMAGARVEVAPYKKSAGDFVLWKPSSDEQPGWDSPWGRGRPGWHIECSAMAEALLGETIDIHGGGHDLIFPHHENEIAQSVCAHAGKPFARYWLHNGFLNVESQKMSKSVGNVLLVHELLKTLPGEAIRLVLLTGHYRQPVDWSQDMVAEARRKLDRLYGALRELDSVVPAADVTAPEAFMAALEDDLNTPMALAELFELARAANKTGDDAERARIKAQLLDAGRLLGLLQASPQAWFSGGGTADTAAESEVEALLARRAEARRNKQWADSDRLRDELKSRGVLVEDSKDGQRWRRA